MSLKNKSKYKNKSLQKKANHYKAKMKYKISCENLFSAVLLFVLSAKFSDGSNQAEKEKTGKYFII